VIGSCSYPTGTWTRVVRLLDRGVVDFEPLVTHRFPAERFEDAFRLMDTREGVVAKVVLEHVSAG
jgi:threonine dehydrogenase-like Zn-dependent dehydrogenase